MKFLSTTTIHRALFVIVLLMLCNSRIAYAQPNVDPATKNFLEKVRLACAQDEPLKGILIYQTEKSGNKLSLSGLLDAESQKKLLLTKANEFLKFIKPLNEKYTEGVDLSKMSVVPLRSVYLERLQKELATPPWKNDTDQTIFPRTRLDDLYFHAKSNKLILKAVCLDPTIDLGLDKKKSEALVRKRLKKFLHQYFVEINNISEFKTFKIEFGQPRITLLDNPVFTIQNKLTTESQFDHIWVRSARYNAKGQLILFGYVDEKDRAALSTVLAEDNFQKLAAVHRSRMPNTIDISELKPINWPLARDKFQTEFKTQFPIAQEGSVIDKTIFNRVFLVYSTTGLQIVGTGKCVLPLNETDSQKTLLENRNTLRNRMKLTVGKLWLDLDQELSKSTADAHIEGMDFLEPVLALRLILISKGKFNREVVTAAEFTSNRILDIHITGPNEDRLKEVEKWMNDHPEELKTVLLTPNDSNKKAWTLKTEIVQRAEQLRNLQKNLILRKHLSENNFYWRTSQARLDDMYLALTNDLFWKVKGVVLCDFALDDSAESLQKMDTIRRLLKFEFLLKSKEWSSISSGINTEMEIKFVNWRSLKLQSTLINKNRELDGVYLSNLLFGETGQLLVSGLWVSDEHKKKILELVGNRMEKTELHPLRGITTDDFNVVRSDLILRGIRDWADTHYDEVLTRRLYFTEAGNLQLEAIIPDDDSTLPDAFRAYGRKLLMDLPQSQRELIPTVWRKKLTHLQAIGRCATRTQRLTYFNETMTAELPDIGFDLTSRKSVTKYLRDHFMGPDDKAHYGILIDRGIYGDSGTLIINGLYATTKQKKAIEEKLKELSEDPIYELQLSKGWNVAQFKEVPIQPMLDGLKVVMPAYPELDRLILDRAFHDKDKTFVLGGEVFGAANPDASALLKKLLGDHDFWKVRIYGEDGDFGLKLDVKTKQVNAKASRAAVRRCLELIRKSLPDRKRCYCKDNLPILTPPYILPKQKLPLIDGKVCKTCLEYLDGALLHTPENSTAWFLRALCHISLGQEELAKRDLRRMVRLEEQNPIAKDLRLLELEHIQGSLRILLADFARHISAEILNGQPPMVMPAYPPPSAPNTSDTTVSLDRVTRKTLSNPLLLNAN